MPLDYLLSALVTLFVVVDPIGLAPAFLAVTHGLPASARRAVGLRACLIAFGILIGAALIGDWLLAQLGIGLPAFRVAGGLLLFWIAFDMVFGERNERQSKEAEEAIEERVRNVAAFPLAIPLMAGPGAITATVLLAGQSRGEVDRLIGLIGLAVIIALVMLSCLAVYWAATRIERWLGASGNAVQSRILGVLLAALAVQYVIDGVRAALGG